MRVVFNTIKNYAKKNFESGNLSGWTWPWLTGQVFSLQAHDNFTYLRRPLARLCFVAIAPHFVCFRWSAKSWIMCYDNHTYMTHLDIRNNQIMSRTSNNKSFNLILLRYNISIWCFRLPFLSCSRIDIQTTKCPRLQHGE